MNLNELFVPNMTQLDLIPTLFSFIMCVIMSFIVRDFYIRRSFSLTGKMHIGSIIPVLSTVVFLVIIVVKSSLALSLGLVGALSIVRFRTPIKEPEELVYLFLSIAIGLGYAAGHILITTVITLLIILMIYIWLSNRKVLKTNEYNLVVKWEEQSISLDNILNSVADLSQTVKLVRLDKTNIKNTAVMFIVPEEGASISLMIDELQDLSKNISVTFFEAKTNW